MNSTLPDIKRGLLEHLLGVDRANEVRDRVSFLTPQCTWGTKIDRCKEDADVRHRISDRFDWHYSCNRHAFHPNYHDILGRVNRPANDESDWEWVGEEQELPHYAVPPQLK